MSVEGASFVSPAAAQVALTLNDVPDDLLLLVASELNATALRALGCVSKRWASAVRGEELATLWLWKRACCSSPLYSPGQCMAFRHQYPLPSVAAAERLCTWASSQQPSSQPCSELLSLSRHAVSWMAEGLARLKHGMALLQWLVQAEEEVHQQHLQILKASPPRSEPWPKSTVLGPALKSAAIHGNTDALTALLGSCPQSTLREAGLNGGMLMIYAGQGGHVVAVTHCLKILGADQNLLEAAMTGAASTDSVDILWVLIGLGLDIRSRAACLSLACGGQNNRAATVQVLLGCTCPQAASVISARKPATMRLFDQSIQSYTGTSAKKTPEEPLEAVCAGMAWRAEGCPGLDHPGIMGGLARACDNKSSAAAVLLLAHVQSPVVDADRVILPAAQTGNVPLLQLLLAHKACEGGVARGCAGRALLAAVHASQAQAVLLLARRSDVADAYPDALYQAADQGAIDIVNILLSHPPATPGTAAATAKSLIANPCQGLQQSARHKQHDNQQQRLGTCGGSAGSRDVQSCGLQDVLGEALYHAMHGGHLDTMQLLLRHGADPCWKQGMCLLSALSCGLHDAGQVLLDWGAGRGPGVGEAVRAAAVRGDARSLQMLFAHALQHTCPQGGSAQEGCGRGMTAGAPTCTSGQHAGAGSAGQMLGDGDLHAALQMTCQGGHLETAQQVLGAWTALHGRLQQQGMLAREILQHATLVAEGLCTALADAAKARHQHVFRWLLSQLLSAELPALEQQVRLDQLQSVAVGLLHAAAAQGQVEVIQGLLDTGAVPSQHLLGWAGQQAVQAAAEHSHVECVRWLLLHGADANAETLHAAVEQPDPTLAHVLLQAACPLAPDALSVCPGVGQAPAGEWVCGKGVVDDMLWHAIQAGSVLCTQLLLRWGASVAGDGGELLTAACRVGSYKLVRILLEAGADACAVRADEVRSLVERGWVDVALLLRQAALGDLSPADPSSSRA